MGRDILEDGPRLGVRFADDDLSTLEEGLIDAGYEEWDNESAGERRFRHPGGSTARLFPESGLLYVYPPGGTRHQTGGIAPFSPLKRECAGANERAGFAAPGDGSAGRDDDPDPSSSSSSADDDGPGDSHTDDEDTDGDD